MPRKSDVITYKEFNKLTDYTDTHHSVVPTEVLFDDENIDHLEETLMGMEYDAEDLDEVSDEIEDEDNEFEASDELAQDIDLKEEGDEFMQRENHIL